jgi:hypothetical protein
MPTKHKTPTADVPPAKPTTAIEAEPAVRAINGKRKPPVYLESLSDVQQCLADLLGDIVAHGGSEEVVSGLVIVARHQWHRRLDHIHTDHAKVEANVKSLAEPDAARWKSELATAWAMSTRMAITPKHYAKNITERIRFSVIRELQGLFDQFLNNGGPEELRLMRDVLQDRYSGGFGDGLAIAEAFLLQADCRRKYVAVPDHMVEDIEKYVQCLLEADVKTTGHAWSDPKPDSWEMA